MQKISHIFYKTHNTVFWAFVASPRNCTFEMSYCLVLMKVEHLVSFFSRHSLNALPVLHSYIEILLIYLMFVPDISENTLNIVIVEGFFLPIWAFCTNTKLKYLWGFADRPAPSYLYMRKLCLLDHLFFLETSGGTIYMCNLNLINI